MFGTLANCGVKLTSLVPLCAGRGEPERADGFPVLIYTGEEFLHVGAAVELGEMMGEGAIL